MSNNNFVQDALKSLNTQRMRVWEEGKALLDDVERQGREMDAEQRQKFERISSRVDEIDEQIRMIGDRERREVESATAREAFERQHGTHGFSRLQHGEQEAVRAWARGDVVRSEDFEAGKRNSMSIDVTSAVRMSDLIRQGASGEELRTLLYDTGSSGSLVPTTMSRTLYQYLEAEVAALRMPTTKITTTSGEPLVFPKLGAHGIATQIVAQGTAIGGTDPTFAKTQLDAYKYGELVQIANEVIQDSGIDIVGFLSMNIARAVGRVLDADLVAGTGTAEPQGMITASITGSAGTVATGGSLITPTYESLVDLQFSVNDAYRARGGAWLMRDATAGNLRKLRDGAGGTVGRPLWEPSSTSGMIGGQPDRLLGYPVFTDPSVASMASNARIIAFGDFSAYYTRLVGNVVVERSDEYAFGNDLATFRGKWRADGDWLDLNAANILKMSVS